MIKTASFKDKLQDLKFIDLFSGIGGFRLALESFEAKCVFSSDNDKGCQKVYHNNFNEMPDGDIKTIDEKKIPKHDILCAGFPCQPFSISGKRGGFEDARGTLFFDIARIVKNKRPKILILENVLFFSKHDKGKTLKTVQTIIEELNYDFFWKIINASDFGIPQSRKRTFMIAIKKNKKKNHFHFPSKIEKEIKLADFLETRIPKESKVFKNGKFKFKKKSPQTSNLFNYFEKKPIRIGTVNHGGQGDRIYSPSGHAITLSAHGGGTGAKTGLYLINDKIRKLTPKECARVSGFPDSFKLSENDSESYKQFGNTVVVDVVQYIVKELIVQKFL
jgi:DNA (cytosine-5)-methyltransferase 1